MGHETALATVRNVLSVIFFFSQHVVCDVANAQSNLVNEPNNKTTTLLHQSRAARPKSSLFCQSNMEHWFNTNDQVEDGL